MKSLIENIHDFHPIKTIDSWAVIGNFDGVHLGHQALIKRMIDGAQRKNQETVLISFWPHPKVYLESLTNPFYLSTFDEKQQILREYGIDHVVNLAFNETLRQIDAVSFLEILVNNFGVKHLVIGQDFSIGRNRDGNLLKLADTFYRLGIRLYQVKPVRVDCENVSSGRIRGLLLSGDVRTAANQLGRSYAIEGSVTRGKGIGSKFGFPTANLKFEPMKILPAIGVYATHSWLRNKKYQSVTNIGVRPTFEIDGKPSVETLLLDFNDNINEEPLRVEFIERIRDEQKFETLEALSQQIERDKKEARRLLSDV